MHSSRTQLVLSRRDGVFAVVFSLFFFVVLFLIGLVLGRELNPHLATTSQPQLTGRAMATPSDQSSQSLDYTPQVFSEGPISVVVDAFTDTAKAQESLLRLQHLGFTSAFIKEFFETGASSPSLQLHLGFFPDTQTAKTSAEILLARKIITSYQVTEDADRS